MTRTSPLVAGLLIALAALIALALPAAASAASPTVKAWAAGPVAPTSADINAQVNPNGSATTYWFEWGASDCSANPCASLPAEHDAFAGSGNTYLYVLRHLTGLEPSTTYHFRVVAENATGTTEGDDQTFTTAAPEPACTNPGMPGTDSLPDCRAYELVSPASKNGADVIPNSYKTVAAADGDGVAFAALGSFGDAAGTSVDVQYVSRRDADAGTSGWRTHSVNPPGRAPTLIGVILVNLSMFEAFTPDLTGGIYKSWKALTEAPNVAGVSNLYRMRGLDGSDSQAELISSAASPIQPPDPVTKLQVQSGFDGASKDLSHVIFQSPYDLTGDGSFSSSGDLYESVEGLGVRRVGRVPSGSDTACDDVAGPACVDAPSVQAGISVSLQYGSSQYGSGMISDDGRRILFQGPAGSPAGPIYMREDGVRTYQIDASEKVTPDAPAGGQLWGMSADGSRVFFLSGEELVDADEDGQSNDLYMYDVTAPAGSRLTLLSADDTGDVIDVASVIGASADGHYVYFVSSGQLVAGEPSIITEGLYLWHDGQISYIGMFEDSNLARFNTPGTGWNLVSATKTSRVSPDGRHLLFMMQEHDEGFAGRGGYPGYDHGTCGNGCRELYLYSAESGRLTCVSCNPRANAATDNAFTDAQPGISASLPTQHLSHALSDDGQHVFFTTGEALVAEDTNNASDAYSYEVPTGTLRLVSSGTSSADSYFMDASPDGSDVFFATRERLVGWDIDDSYDLYDARINGGFSEPAPVPAACEGESCLPSTPPAPPARPTSSHNAGPGNRCPKGTHRVRRHGKVHCAKKHRRHAHRKHRKTNADQGAGR